MPQKLVSVIVPTYKSPNVIVRAVDSVLAQTYQNFEVIVVDDNDPESSFRRQTEEAMLKYANNPNVVYIKHKENLNGSAARNTGLLYAKGEYVSFLDDDDEYLPTRLEKCVSTLENKLDYCAVYTNVYMLRQNKITIKFKAKMSGNIWKELLLDEGLLGTGSNIFIRRSTVKATGNFDERFIRYQDVEFMLRVLEKNKIFALDDFLVKKHLSDRNVPNYKKSLNNKKAVFNKFGYLINRLSSDERKLYFSDQYKKLLNIALLGKRKEDISDAKKNLEQFRKTSLFERICCRAPFLYSFSRSLYHSFRKLFSAQ